MHMSTSELSGYMISELGRVGDTSTLALLHTYVPDREFGPLAVEAIRMIERRVADSALADAVRYLCF